MGSGFIRRTATVAGSLAAAAIFACGGEHQGPGEITGAELPVFVVEAREQRAAEAAAALPGETRTDDDAESGDSAKQILFGDLHVHTTYSPDALMIGLPIMGGEGAHPPADACDFARYCSGLDFWSINDHAEGVTPQRWAETKESIRQCNAVASDPANPDMVSFLGWEWSQVSLLPENHYGHTNVIFHDTAEPDVPTRAIAAPRDQLGRAPMGRAGLLMLALTDWENRAYYRDVPSYYREIAETPRCPDGVEVHELPDDCHETAKDPATLFAKLDEWGFDSIVIPHGNSWGLNTPPGTSFDKQLTPEQHDPDRQILFEVFSGHGNSEEYRDWRAVTLDADGGRSCPEASDGYLPCCRRAGEIIRSRCEDPGSDVCEARVVTARQNYVDAGVTGYWTVPGTSPEDWLECGQCTDCFMPPFDHRPMTTAQYALAISNLETSPDPLRFRFGLIGSSDNHRARGGTGYKEFARIGMTEASGPRSERIGNRMGDDRDPAPESVRYDHGVTKLGLAKLRHMERQASFWMTGGLVATHAMGRDRTSIWESLKRREVYATSGDRILLWFDLLRPDGGSVPMGSETTATSPRFRVRAAGAFEQLPGCPTHALESLGPERTRRLCLGECHHPGDARRRIARIEVVRIRPRIRPDEAVGSLVEDPWRTFTCPDDPAGCVIEFDDPDFAAGAREVIYYVRALQEPTPTINADGLRCETDADGVCVAVDPCYGDWRTSRDDDCLAESMERAWSSPIFVAPQRPAG
jgi:hypothetical protein